MSLADLYREDQTQSEDEDEFVPSEASSSESEHEDEEGSNTPPPTEEQRQQSKRRIDEIWQEMNQPTAKTPRTESQACSSLPTSPSPSTKQPPPPAAAAAAEPQPTSPSAIPAKEPKPQTAATGRPRRRPSKFSKMAEMVEQRRAKKANTLDTARKSWSGFVAAEGIREDLDKANKDGYVERKEFLDRVDHRTYEKARGMKKK